MLCRAIFLFRILRLHKAYDMGLFLIIYSGIIMSGASSSLLASSILKEMISEFVDQPNTRLKETNQLNDDYVLDHPSILGLCRPFEDALEKCEGNVNGDILAVVSVLFLKLGMSAKSS